jgi:hypothetical protein
MVTFVTRRELATATSMLLLARRRNGFLARRAHSCSRVANHHAPATEHSSSVGASLGCRPWSDARRPAGSCHKNIRLPASKVADIGYDGERGKVSALVYVLQGILPQAFRQLRYPWSVLRRKAGAKSDNGGGLIEPYSSGSSGCNAVS